MGVSSAKEAYFVFAVGLLLSLNSGYINGLCMSGLLTEGGSFKQGVSAFTGTYTKSGLALANGEAKLFGFEFTLILSFIGGAMLTGLMNPKAIPHKLVPSYGPTFLLGSLCMISASIAAVLHPDGRTLYYFAAMANGIQNGITSTYSANLIRTSHLTGTSTDIGLIIGQMIRGNWKNYWKFKVLVGLASSFWFGGLISFYSVSAFLSNSLWFSAALYLTIGLTHLSFVVLTQKVSFVQACVGNWKWDRVLEHMATSMSDGNKGSVALSSLTSEQIDHVFDEIDQDGSGEIDADELKDALEKMGIKLTRKNVASMIDVVDDNGDGVVDRQEFHTLVGMATLRAVHKQESRRLKTVVKIRNSLAGRDRTDDVSSTSSAKSFGSKCEEKKKQDHSEAMRQLLPKTYQDALRPGKGDDRAIIVTEAKPPFAVVGVNGPWEDLCGYKSSEALQKSMSNLIQGPKTNREGIKHAMEQMNNGAEQVECSTVNYRKDGSMFNNFLTMGPLYDKEDGADEETGKREPAYYVGILMNIGELAQDMSVMEGKEEKEDDRGVVKNMV
eukprot:CAMPEP_0172313388 /NCGR_PEP_ID=MMETSP1058-20130122/20144_1 /TAXON_ID=83371 /ORGANISM="Detonula confervacea, Strain CCMP 353" /LENGTH=554 /DNA_ID=CAMNT_0013027033 /DNA_START=179 /DNA_END=1843 /DNA_ORIENTATION=-